VVEIHRRPERGSSIIRTAHPPIGHDPENRTETIISGSIEFSPGSDDVRTLRAMDVSRVPLAPYIRLSFMLSYVLGHGRRPPGALPTPPGSGHFPYGRSTISGRVTQRLFLMWTATAPHGQ
jgi:hypothetical protein